MRLIQTVTLGVFLTFAWGIANADDWPGWRGPNHNGASEETNLPGKIDLKHNVVWSVDMPGSSSASPVVFGDRVFVASNSADLKNVLALCLDRNTGEVLWEKSLADVSRKSSRNTMASPSPVTDGKHVYFLFGTSDLYALTMDGEEVWSRNLDKDFGPIGQQFEYSSSPLLYRGKLYLPILRGQWRSKTSMGEHSDKDSFLLCLNAATGNVEWKTHRPSDAVAESFDSYGSAVPYLSKGRHSIIVQGGDYVTGHDALTGKELWRYADSARKTRNGRVIPSPVVADNLVCATVPRGMGVFAILPGKKPNMAYSEAEWIYDERTTDVPTPVYYKKKLYVVWGTRKTVTCLDPTTGKELWQSNLNTSSRIWASPVIGDDKIYCLDERGQLTIADIAKGFKILSQTELGGYPAKSTVALANGQLFVRTAEKLYCIGS